MLLAVVASTETIRVGAQALSRRRRDPFRPHRAAGRQPGRDRRRAGRDHHDREEVRGRRRRGARDRHGRGRGSQKGSTVAARAIEAMVEITQSANEIGAIIGVIDEIAFQTNLLALNAGVEAARAGDAGRGFAVVASEVRALAQRCTEAAKEIKGLISASSSQVEQGVKLVNDTGQLLERIVTQVARINEIVGDIAAGVNQQASALGEVNIAVNQMDQVTQKNVEMAENRLRPPAASRWKRRN